VNSVTVVNTVTTQTQFGLPLSLATQRAMWREQWIAGRISWRNVNLLPWRGEGHTLFRNNS
jgi:hypothetical protein